MKKIALPILLLFILSAKATLFRNKGPSFVIVYYYVKGRLNICKLFSPGVLVVENLQRWPLPYFKNCAFIQYDEQRDEYILESPNPQPDLE